MIDLDPCRCCTELYHEPPEPIPVPALCPNCRKKLAANEWFAYGRCENCFVGDSSTSTYAGPKILRDLAAMYNLKPSRARKAPVAA